MLQDNNLSAIEPDNSFEFQKEIENYVNDQNNFNDSSLQSEDISPNLNNQGQVQEQKQNMVMIDQAQLLELMQAKQILDAQKAAQEAKKQAVTETLLTQGFNSALFLTPPKTSQNQATPSTNATSQEQTIFSSSHGASIRPFETKPMASQQQQPEYSNSLFQVQVFNSDNDMNFMKQNSNQSEFHNFKQLRNNNNNQGIDSRFNQDYQQEQESSAANCSALGTSAQGRAIGNDLLNMIDADSSVSSVQQRNQFSSEKKINHYMQPFNQDGVSSQQQLSQNQYYRNQVCPAFIESFQNFNLGDQPNNSPDSNEFSNQSSSLSGSGQRNSYSSSGNEDNFPTIFSQHAGYQPSGYQNQYGQIPNQVPQTVNNIVINNFNHVPSSMTAETVNAPAFTPSKLYFPPLNSVSGQQPTMEEEAELAQATDLVGGIKKLNRKESSNVEKDKKSKEDDSMDKKNLFNFPDGGWECNKCQNYNFKGRKECYRCKKAKDEQDVEGKPEHMSMPKKSKKQKKIEKAEKESVKGSLNGSMTSEARAKKLATPRVGDWTCQRCFNHNFAFRDVCNMCYLSQVESNRMLYSQAQNRFMTQGPMQQQQTLQYQMQQPMQGTQGQYQMPIYNEQQMMFSQFSQMPQQQMEQYNQNAFPAFE